MGRLNRPSCRAEAATGAADLEFSVHNQQFSVRSPKSAVKPGGGNRDQTELSWSLAAAKMPDRLQFFF